MDPCTVLKMISIFRETGERAKGEAYSFPLHFSFENIQTKPGVVADT